MKRLTNNQSNELLFIDNSTEATNQITAEVVQLGSGDITPIPISISAIDCETITYAVNLIGNQLQNASYILRIKDDEGNITSSTTLRVDGNTNPTRSYVVLDSGTGTGNTDSSGGSSGGSGGTGGNTGAAPQLMANNRYYIQTGVEYSLYIPATNNPTHYEISNIIPGLSLDEDTGRITGIPTATEGLDSMFITVSNDYGSDSGMVFFFITDEDASILHPPATMRVGEVRATNFYFVQWEYRPYNGTQSTIRHYRNGAFLYDYANGAQGQQRTGMVNQNLSNLINTYQIKFISDTGEVSRFSDRLLVNGYEAKRVYEHEDVNITDNPNTAPTIKPLRFYYIQKDNAAFTLDLSKVTHNNPVSWYMHSYFSTGTTTEGSYSLTGDFDEDTGILTTLATGDGLVGFDAGTANGIALTATNANGTSPTTYIYVTFVDEDPNIISKPINLAIETVEEDFITWEYPAYNKVIKVIEVYQNDVLVKSVFNDNNKGYIIGTGIDIDSVSDVFKLRFQDEDGLYSEFSDTI
tara:strand:+ start:1529 stop:3097 length:1569 start_codon:yes stop_codon:yes gene_type:complete